MFLELAKATEKGPVQLGPLLVDRSKMDETNKKAMNVAAKGGTDAFVKHVFTNQETGNR